MIWRVKQLFSSNTGGDNDSMRSAQPQRTKLWTPTYVKLGRRPPRFYPPTFVPSLALHDDGDSVSSNKMEAASARMASRDRFGGGFGEPTEPKSRLQRSICGN